MMERPDAARLNQNHVMLLRQLVRERQYILKSDATGIIEIHDANGQPVQVIQGRNFLRLLEGLAIEKTSETNGELGVETRYDITTWGRQVARGTNPRTWAVYKVFCGETFWWRPLDERGYTQGWTSEMKDAGRWTVGQARKYYDEFMKMAGQPGGEVAGYGYKEIGD